jgi:PST family polysaccharide transporter
VKAVIKFVSVIVLSRLLTPADFGVVAAVAPLVAFVTLLQELGLRQSVVQRQEIGDQQLNRVFWVTVLAGLACMVAVMAAAPGVAAFYGDPRLTYISMAAGFPLLLSSMTVLPLGLMGRRLQFKQLALNDVLGALAGFIASVWAAYLGLGYWSLVIGTAATAAVMLAAGWRAARWVPGKPDFRIDRDIFSFGANLTGFNFVNFLRRNSDNILVGRFVGIVELGYYDRAYKLLLFPIQSITNPMGRVIIPILSRFQDDKSRLRDAYLRAVGILALLIIPGVAALAANAEETVRFLLSERWLPAAPIFAWLGLVSIVQPIANSGGWLFISQGRTGDMLRLGVISSLTTVAAFVVGLKWGAVGVAAAYAITTLSFQPLRWWYLGRMGPVTFRDLAGLQLPYVVSAGLTFLTAHIIRSQTDWAAWQAIIVSIGVSYCLALAAIATVSHGRRIIAEIFSLLRSTLGWATMLRGRS